MSLIKREKADAEARLQADAEVVTKDELLDRLREEIENLQGWEIEDLAKRYLDVNPRWGCERFADNGKEFFRLRS